MEPPRLALGTAQLGHPYGIANRRGRLAPTAVDRILRTAFDLGIRCLDTAAEYGEAETAIGRFLHREGRPEGLEICTKLPRLPANLSSDELDRAVAETLARSRERLGVERIDCYLIHAPANLREYGRGLVEALARRRDAGRIGRIGVSVYETEEAAEALAYPELSAIQFPFNVFDRRVRATGALDELRARGCATFARSALLQGLLTLRPDALPQAVAVAEPWMSALRALLASYGVDPIGGALCFAAARSGADHLVLGVDSHEQLHDSVRALQGALPAGLLKELDEGFSDVPLRVSDPRCWSAGAA